ncbi:hypothetical protein OLMES_5308 [Oleiphilus messinensis]|uniref:Polyketide cyclase / dehydrase and lipid transport n=1 Tax=Oleiphilus messinensis TaxID=141451 RepID=A0A1Y0IFK3_9GAMM|nr:SRPBCC family protein [Oleiphilus messinensis]ARU59288.1 hypothetical protein OLMES_5308 [Oleiphilus messinensis]
MKMHDVQSIDLNVPAAQAYAYIAESENLPHWTHAFASVSGKNAVMKTPGGEVPIELRTEASREQGTVDWFMVFPDGSVASAYSRVVNLTADQSVFSFTLLPPPVPLEQLEGTLQQQSEILASELTLLKHCLEGEAVNPA